MSHLPANHHTGKRLAHASQNLALQRWWQPTQQPANAASRLPLANSCPKVDVVNRVPQGTFERLEPDDGKLSRPVLRGLGGSDAPRLPGVSNNPVRNIDPTGHMCVGNSEECQGDKRRTVFLSSPLLEFETDPGQEFTAKEKQALRESAQDTAEALAREINRHTCTRAHRKMGECGTVTPQEAFYEVYGGPVKVRRVNDSCANCNAQYKHDEVNGNYIAIYSNTTEQTILNSPGLLVHELGHAFIWRAVAPSERLPDGAAFLNANGFDEDYSYGTDDSDGAEIFADMFVGWVYGKWGIVDPLTGDLSDDAREKSNYMADNMPNLVHYAVYGW